MDVSVYWIEDEMDLLTGIAGEIERRGGHIKNYRLASQVIEDLDSIKAEPGPIILDLWLPAEGDSEIKGLAALEGPEIGMWLLRELQKHLGAEQQILILSGNLSMAIRQRLGEHGFTRECVYSKPIVEKKADEFIDAIVGGGQAVKVP